mgnify:CR=1 FL=1
MLMINLGTNDMGHYGGVSWGHDFVSTYVNFVNTATARYGKPKMPVFVVQGNMNNDETLYSLLMKVVS